MKTHISILAYLGLVLLQVVVSSTSPSNSAYIQTKISQANGAACLDGSAPVYYYSPPSSDTGKQNFIIYFQGGGWCYSTSYEGTVNDCENRAKSDLGSSNAYPSSYGDIGGMLSSDSSKNPHFFDWHRIYIKYCDGSGHQGYRDSPLVTNSGAKLYFRGMQNTIGIFEHIRDTYGLFSADRVLISGCSAGGLAVYNWGNWVRDFVPSTTKVFLAPDSGFFLDYNNVQTNQHTYTIEIQNILAISNAEVDPMTMECNTVFMNEKWRCFFAQNIVQHLRAPLFYIQPQYDTWSMPNILGISCFSGKGELSTCDSASLNSISKFRNEQVERAEDTFLNHANWGGWMPACLNHCYTSWDSFNYPTYNVPNGSGYTLSETLWKWINNEATPFDGQNIDLNPWPSNSGCAVQ